MDLMELEKSLRHLEELANQEAEEHEQYDDENGISRMREVQIGIRKILNNFYASSERVAKENAD